VRGSITGMLVHLFQLKCGCDGVVDWTASLVAVVVVMSVSHRGVVAVLCSREFTTRRHLQCPTLSSLYMSIANTIYLLKAQYINKKGNCVSGP